MLIEFTGVNEVTVGAGIVLVTTNFTVDVEFVPPVLVA